MHGGKITGMDPNKRTTYGTRTTYRPNSAAGTYASSAARSGNGPQGTRPAAPARTGSSSGTRAYAGTGVPSNRSAASKKRRCRSKKIRRRNRILKAIAILVLLLAIIGMATAVLMDHLAEKTVQLYPMEYTDLILENAALQGVDPAYVAAVILAESSYNPQAVSNVNAQGLMQIMPDTGEWISRKFDEEYYDGCLFEPEKNIRYGTWFLGYLSRKYDGDKVCSTAAYHSGHGTVDKWLANPEFSSDGKTLDVINGPNANTYVKRVLEYYEKYQELYAEEFSS